ncbi:glycosyltransferase family 2 protein [Photobacterium leiognathi]|uniref:glycosyltransferase family 2 protein n=1 Tax=Photobacterium leiognathi TaxID=553611 RepID=UPI002981205A|nr:glycosyltransferase [Photobacterium leiognathi]
MNKPLVSIILPVYNCGDFLHESVSSILEQSYSNLQIIIVNDGSTDNSKDILEGFDDSRINLISRENKGLIYTLNEALSLCDGKYIARMDGDDISHKERIFEQVKYLEKNKDIAVLGCSANVIDMDSIIIGNRFPPRNPKVNKSLLLFGPTLIHPSVMFNKELIGDDLYYDINAYLAEDYELWLRLSSKYKISNMKDILFDYRYNNKSVSNTNIEKQKKSAARIYIEKSEIKNNDLFFDAVNIINLRENYSKLTVFKSVLTIIKRKPISSESLIRLLYVLRWMIR